MSGSSVGSAACHNRRGGGWSGDVLSIVALLGPPALVFGILFIALSVLLASPAFASGPRVLEELPICTVGGDQLCPAVSGNYVVWDDMRGLEAIYGYNLTTKKEFRISGAKDAYPAISRNIVVWEDWTTGNGDIYGYNLTTKTGFAVCTESHGQWSPAISRNIVVWQDHRSPADDIYGYNLTTKREFPICTAGGYQEYPAVSGNYIVWEDYRSDLADSGGSSDIYGYNLATGTEFPISTGPGNQCDPQVSGNIVVWDDDSAGNGDIYGYNLTTGAKFAICTAGGDQWYPTVSGNTVVWADSRNGATDIYARDLTTGTEFPICIAAGSQRAPRISGNTVVWGDKRDLVDDDIYGATLSAVMTGYVFDGHGAMGVRDNSVQDAKVEISEVGIDEVLDSDYTDKDGKFSLSFDLEPLMEYTVRVTLESKDKRLVMKRDGTTVTFSRDVTGSSLSASPLEIDCSKVAKITEASMAKGDIDNCASVWHYLQLNRQVAKEIGEDLTETLTVNVFWTPPPDEDYDYYDQGQNAIYLHTQHIDDDTHAAAAGQAADAYPPPWNFRKNRETHEFGHAMMNVILSGGWTAAPDVENHAGYVNANTGDSLAEGFAEFWCMFADAAAGMSGDPDKYDHWGHLATTNRRMAWSPVDPAAPMATPTDYPDEEFAVAGVLRHLQDDLGGGKTGFLKITDNLSAGGNLIDLYNNLLASGVAAETIDHVFFQFGFFADKNGNWELDADEAVGAGNGAACKMEYDQNVGPVDVAARPDRHDHPFDPDSFVVVNLNGVPGPASESWVTLEIRHTGDPAADYSDAVLIAGPTGLINVDLDEAATGAVISARGADGVVSADKLTFTAVEWETARSAAVDDVALTQTFRVDRVTVGNPVAPKRMSPVRRYTVTSTLKPRHTAGTYPVRVYKYRYVSGKWKSYGYVKAKAANYSTYTRCSCKVRLSLKGSWRLRALAPPDAFHKATWSRGYTYVTVK
jgi:beta propeller repeat protein